MSPDELLDFVDSTLYAWEVIKEEFLDNAAEVIEEGKWVLHYAKEKGWFI